MIEIINCEQGSPAWFALRLGIPTASMFGTVRAKGKGGGESVTRKEYMRKLAGEIVTGEVTESYSNAHTERGKLMEPEARDLYAFMKNAEPECVGFVRDTAKGAGASPDSFLGTGGMLEIKTKLPHLLIEAMEREDFPPEHRAQCQGGLWIAEREWIDIAIYWPKMPLIVHRAYRDEAYIKDLAEEVKRFNAELHELVQRVRRYGEMRVAALQQNPTPCAALGNS